MQLAAPLMGSTGSWHACSVEFPYEILGGQDEMKKGESKNEKRETGKKQVGGFIHMMM